jgi:hypothetical protein
MRSLRSVDELMADEPKATLRAPREVRNHASKIAFRIDRVLASFEEVKRYATSKRRRVNVASQAVKVNIANVMIDDQTGITWNFDVVIEIEFYGAGERERWWESSVPGKICGDDEFVATTLHRDLHPIQIVRGFLALCRSIRGFRRFNRGNLNGGLVPPFNREFACRVLQPHCTA